MLMTGHKSLSLIMRVLLDVLLAANILALIFLPFLLTKLYENPEIIKLFEPEAKEAGPDIVLRDGEGLPDDMPMSSYPFYLGFAYAAGIGSFQAGLPGENRK